MRNLQWASVVAVGLALLVPQPGRAAFREVKPGVYYSDFEDGELGLFGVDEKEKTKQPRSLSVVQDGPRKAVRLEGGFHTRVFYTEKKFKDFSLEVRMKKTRGSYAGVVVRDHWWVFFRLKGFLCLSTDLRRYSSRLLFQSAKTFTGYHDVKIVCAGPILRVSVDGQPMFEFNIGPGDGRIGFYAHHAQAYYDRLRVDTHVDPRDAVFVEPVSPNEDGSLVYAPEENVKLTFRVGNFSGAPQKVILTSAVKTWDGKPVTPLKRDEVTTAVGAYTPVVFDMGRIGSGFYRIDMTALCGGRRVGGKNDLPLAVQKRPTGAFEPPLIPIAPYSRYDGDRNPIYQHTYAHAIAQSLKDHHFNAIVAGPSFTDQVVDIFRSYGIATITRSSKAIGHPGVIGALVGDEPKIQDIERYQKYYEGLRKQTDKPFTTCMVGEGLGLGGVVKKWRLVAAAQGRPALRAFRWYGVKKHFYDALHKVTYKGTLPFPDVMRVAEAASDTPLWVILPSFGGNQHEAYFQNPSPAQLACLMHLSLAYGADGLLFYTFQVERARWPALVEQKSLKPCDGKYDAAASVAARIQANAALLRALEHGSLDIRCPSARVDVVPRRRKETGRNYVYVVNMDAGAPVKTNLIVWSGDWTLTNVSSVYTGRDFPVERDPDGYFRVPLTLEPGEGDLLLTDAKHR